ncbi:MAG: asparaginase [Acidobacteria bacterium]|nr:MAG: asparaginase [Acidobacteriota bacterium]
MPRKVNRREFVKSSFVTPAAIAAAPTMLIPSKVKPVVISDVSGIRFKNGGPMSSVEMAFYRMTQGDRVIDAVVAGVQIPENDPEESGIGYGGLPNADGVVQLDSCCMDGPTKRAGGVAAIEGVRTPSVVAKAVMENTDHHLLVGAGAQSFARNMGVKVEDDLNTEKSRKLWLEWKRRIDPKHYLDPKKRADAGYRAGLSMVADGLISEDHFWGTTNCNAINEKGEIAGVTTTSGLSFKIPGRTGDSPILGAGLYVDGDVGAAGSTGRGEANLYNLCSFFIVEQLRGGMHPKDAGMEALRRVQANTVEKRLLNDRGLPSFNLRFFVLNKKGEYAGVAMYASGEQAYAACDENGAEERPLEGFLDGSPTG